MVTPRRRTVSIHAPAGGATNKSMLVKRVRVSFNPRARGGRDSAPFSLHRPSSGFNPRARGGRDYDPDGKCRYTGVSIHAPAGGATIRDEHIAQLVEFQSTRPRGARPIIDRYQSPDDRFNPRARGGRDTRSRQKSRHLKSFNPRARGGRDALAGAYRSTSQVSIHAPAGGATLIVSEI